MNHRRTTSSIIATAVLALGFAPMATGQDQNATAKIDSQLDGARYRLKVEAILQSNDDTAIFRVQLWTLNKQEVLFDYGGQVGREGILHRDKNGTLYRTEFLIVVFRHGPPKANNVECELRLVSVGERGMTSISHPIDTKTNVESVIELPSLDIRDRIGGKRRIGTFLKVPLTIHVK
jgi:hypothetical protein